MHYEQLLCVIRYSTVPLSHELLFLRRGTGPHFSFLFREMSTKTVLKLQEKNVSSRERIQVE